jgi:thiol-disulfide isomerase/thioredoxin
MIAARKPSRALLYVAAFACLAGAVALLILAGLPSRAAYSGQMMANGQAIAPEIGAFAPPWRAETLAGSIDLEQLRGSPVIVNFWATWCVPCRIEMPELQAFHAAHPSARVVAVNLGEARGAVVDWVKQLGLTFDIALDPDGSIASLYRLRGQPSTYVVSPGGVIISIFYGPTTKTALEAALEPFLRE